MFSTDRLRAGSGASQRGFTLLEVLVALAVLATGIIAILSGFSLSLQASTHAARLEEAVDLAQNRLESAIAAPPAEDAVQQGKEGFFTWTVRRADKPEGLVLATTTVQWTERGEPQEYRLAQLFRPRP